jgi:hypothetical protein
MMLEMPRPTAGKGPTLATVVEVGKILEGARGEGPISLAEIGRRMSAKRVRHSAIRTSVDFLKQLGFVMEGTKGVHWTFNRDRRFWAAARRARPL